jgi:hypothetical protein
LLGEPIHPIGILHVRLPQRERLLAYILEEDEYALQVGMEVLHLVTLHLVDGWQLDELLECGLVA